MYAKQRREAFYEWRRQTPEKQHRYRRAQQLRIYGMRAEDYEALLASQGGGCAICGTKRAYTKSTRYNYFCVDHDHETGKVRGLLCRACNGGIGQLRDDPELLRKAIAYLEETP